MKNIIILLILGLLLITACSVQKANEGATTKSDYGYVRLAGSMLNREAYIDGTSVGVDPEADTNTFRIKAGMHLLEIHSRNRALLSEQILVTAGQTVEITVP
ncbi:MAG: hypothetical protein K0B87_09075 [Candidatus Syntrophosphaera sp.]|nr:hypothetical protein [Candidatus Syntrophosphaera sp.]